jgi:hypothetical protein
MALRVLSTERTNEGLITIVGPPGQPSGAVDALKAGIQEAKTSQRRPNDGDWKKARRSAW